MVENVLLVDVQNDKQKKSSPALAIQASIDLKVFPPVPLIPEMHRWWIFTRHINKLSMKLSSVIF